MLDDNFGISFALDTFTAKCDDLVQSKYILADKKISALMKFIATNNIIVEVVRDCVTDFNLENEFAIAKRENEATLNKQKLVLPATRKKQVAFVFCLLVEFDTGKRNLADFLKKYFYVHGNMFECYEEFCVEFIKPFKRNIEIMLKETADKTEGAEVDDKQIISISSQVPLDIKKEQVSELLMILNAFNQKISSFNFLNYEEKNEFSFLIDGFCNAIALKDARLIKLLWICFKNTFKQFKKMQKTIALIGEKLKNQWLI